MVPGRNDNALSFSPQRTGESSNGIVESMDLEIEAVKDDVSDNVIPMVLASGQVYRFVTGALIGDFTRLSPTIASGMIANRIAARLISKRHPRRQGPTGAQGFAYAASVSPNPGRHRHSRLLRLFGGCTDPDQSNAARFGDCPVPRQLGPLCPADSG
jgi:hypothetical protein